MTRIVKRILSILAVLATAAIFASPALATTAPVGVWNLDEGSGTTVSDVSGNGNNGVLSGGVSWVTGVFGSALSFNGSSGQVKVSDNTALEPSATVTVSAWVEQAGSPGDYRYVLAKGANGCIAASYGLYTGPDGGLEFYVAQGHGASYARSPDAGQGIWDGKWHLAVGTYDGSTIRLYLDGTQVGQGTAWSGALEYLLPNSNDFYIGNYPGCSDHGFAGAVDNVMVWNRVLGASEISGLEPAGDPPGPGQTSPPSGGGGGTGATGGTGSASGGGGSHATGGVGAGTKANGPAPSVHDVKLSISTVTVDLSGHVVSRGSPGVSLNYTESQGARVTVTLLRSQKGVRRGTRCVSAGAGTRRLDCTRFVVVSSVVHTGEPGRLTVRLTQLFSRRLTPGSYRLDVTPRAHGKVGRTVSVHLMVARTRLHQ
jgi:concanavalin A-like lectin/glucanase superfamily protein